MIFFKKEAKKGNETHPPACSQQSGGSEGRDPAGTELAGGTARLVPGGVATLHPPTHTP